MEKHKKTIRCLEDFCFAQIKLEVRKLRKNCCYDYFSNIFEEN